MKHKLFIFCIILFSLNTIILGNLSKEFLDYIEDEKIKEITIDITDEPKTDTFFLTLNNETLKSTAHITLNLGINPKDLINIKIFCENEDAKYTINLYEENNDIINKKEVTGEYNVEIQTNDYPEANKFYINITIEAPKLPDEEIYYLDETYSFEITTSSKNYDFKTIKDNDEIIFDNSNLKEFSYVQNNDLKNGKKKIIITFLGSGINTFNVNYYITRTNNKKDKDVILKQNFFNGFGLIIDKNILNQNSKKITFQINLNQKDYQEIIYVKTRKYSNDDSINVNEYFDIVLDKNSGVETQCVNIINSQKINSIYSINYISYTQNIEAEETSYYQNPTNQESMTEIIDINSKKQLCFKFISNTESSYGTLSIQLMDISIDNPTQVSNKFRVIRGLPTYHYLSNSAYAIFKPQTYLKSRKGILNIHFQMIEGTSELYTYYINELKKEEKYQDFNRFIFVRKTLTSNNDDTYAMVKCTDGVKNCKYVIEIKDESENSYLYPDLRWYDFISNDNVRNYIFNVKDKQNNDLLLNINSFSYNPSVVINIGGSDIKTLDNKYNDEYLLKNKISYKIKKENFAYVDYISIKVKNNDNSGAHMFYGINYQIKDDDKIPLESGILYSYQLSTDLNFYHKYKNSQDNSIININTFSNDISVNEQKPQNNLIQITNPNDFTLKTLTQGDNIVNFEVHEISANSRIFMEIGHLYRNKLTKNGEIIYSYVFTKSGGNQFVINFKKFSNIPAKIKFTLNKNNIDEEKEIIINKLSKSIIIEEDNMKCFEEFDSLYKVCIFDIKVNVEKIEDNNDSLDFSIQLVKYDESTPIYLPQNTFMSGLLIPQKRITYYTEIKETSSGKIFVDLLGGEGKLTAEIKNKDDEVIEGDLSFDNKYFDIQREEVLSQCKDGCYIYIYLYLGEFNSNYEYNIYFKTEKSTDLNLNVPEGEYVYGYFGEQADNYRTKIVRKNAKVSFYVNCENCILKAYDKNEKEYDYYCMTKAHFILDINDELNEIKYSIKNNDKETTNKKYNIKVVSFFDKEPLIIPINSMRNEICTVKKDTPCYFFVSNEDYNKINYLQFLVHNADNANISIANCKDKNIYDISIKNFIIDDNNYETYPKNKYISIKNEKEDLIVRVQLDYTENITFVSSIYELISEATNNNYYQEEFNIIDLSKISKIYPFEKGLIHYEMYLIEGKGYIKESNQNEKYVLESGFQESINIIDSADNPTLELSLDVSTKCILYYRININRNNKPFNFIDLNFQKSNYFKYLNDINNESFWPLSFSMKLRKTESPLKNIHFNYKFSNKYNSQSVSDEFFKVKIYLTSEKSTFNSLNEGELLELNKTDYIYEFTSGYALIEAETIKNKIPDNDKTYYLIIEIDTQFRDIYKEINLALTLFDLSDNYAFPMNEYLLMLINQTTNVNIGRDFNNKYMPFIEFAFQNLDFSFDDPNIKSNEKFGKTFSNLEQNKTCKLILNKKSESEIIKPNIINKYAIYDIDKDIYTIFKLSSDEVNGSDDTNQKEIYFAPVEIALDYLPGTSSYLVYNIRIYDRLKNRHFSPNSILEEKPSLKNEKYLNQTNNKITYNIDFKGLNYGLYYVSVLAEARKGSAYEYFLYEPFNITVETDKAIVDIEINRKEQYEETGYSKDFIFNGTIRGEGKYIKLYLIHKDPLEENFIYASQDESLIDSNNPYKDSQFKTIDRETALIIPMNEINSNSPLYIRIPCKKICTYDFHYVIYDDIEINDNQCFDINIGSSNNFTYKKQENNFNSLFTFTGYSLQDFTVTEINSKQDAKKTYFNGYSYLVNSDYNSELTFKVEGQLRTKICHRFLNEGDDGKVIIDGDKIYTKLNNNEECFNIKKSENISKYSLTFISKTKNIKAKFFRNNNKVDFEEEINEESKNILLGKENNKFCLSKSGKDEEDAGVFFQLISDKGSQNSPEMNLLLIKGVSTLQKIGKGQSIYYRINEYNLPNSYSNITNNININFQKITGNTKVELAKCSNFPDCDFERENTLGEYFLNNIYYNYDTKSQKDIYHESDFPVVIVSCLDNNETDDEYCNYYIQMSNNEEVKLLNKNNKVFSFVQDKEETFKINKNPNDKVYLQIHTLTGEVNVHSSENEKFEYNNNTKFLLFNDDSKDINIKINGTKNSLYNIYYYTEEDSSFYLSNGEVQYNIISKNENKTYYFYHKLKSNHTNKYIVSINAINCYLAINKNYKNEEGKRYYQKLIENDESLRIEWFYKDEVKINENDKCEFTISSSEIKDGNPKELIINDGIYYYYSLKDGNNGNFNSVVLHYLFSKNEDKNMLININKKSDNDLKITYEFKNNNKDNHKTRSINKFKDLFYINYQGDSQNNSESNYIDNIEYLIITISSTSSEQIDFRININGRKNMPIYLDPEEIEYGIVQKGEKVLYYFDYYKNKTENNHQIYLHNKGTAKIENIRIQNKINGEEISDNNIDNSGNYVNIKGNECQNGCRICFSIYLDGNENNKTKDYNLFNVYRHSISRKLYVPENTNIYGYFNSNIENRHFFISKTNFEKLKITLNCQNCEMLLPDKKPNEIKISNSAIIEFQNEKITKDYFVYEISSKKEGYYYFSFTYISSNKYIDQLEPEKCFSSTCLFIVPLHNYYMYTQNNIILFVPDNEQVVISRGYYKMNEYENDNLDSIDFQDSIFNDTSRANPIKNWLLVDISSHYNQSKYLIIKIERIYEEGDCTLMISQFYNSLNSLNIQYREKIYINDNELKGSSLESTRYKFDLILINGSGSVSFMLNNEEKYKYYLNYDSRESMSLIMEMGENSSMKTQKVSEKESFIYYLNITERGEETKEIDKLVLQKVNTFKYYNDFKSTKYKILYRPNDLIINFRFLNLIKDEDVDKDNYDVENVKNEDFKFEIKRNSKGKHINIEDDFYSKSLRRGYIYLKKGDTSDYYELTISKNSSKPYRYKNIFLEITPLYIEDDKNNNIINIPRNTYLQLKVDQDKEYSFSFYKPNNDYQDIKVELANTSDIEELKLNNTNISIFSFDGFGKKNIYFNTTNNTQNPNIIKIKFMEPGKILIKNTPINNGTFGFSLDCYNASINKLEMNSENDNENNKYENNETITNNTFHISHYNLKIMNNNNTNNLDYKVTYIIRLFDYLDYYDDDEIENILFHSESLSKMSFRKELNESEKNEDIIEYDIYTGTLVKGQYYLSIIGEVSYNDTVEYFAFKSIGDDLRIIEPKIFEFDYTWVYVLVSLIVILIILIAYLVRCYIKNKNVVKIETIDDRKQYLLNQANN